MLKIQERNASFCSNTQNRVSQLTADECWYIHGTVRLWWKEFCELATFLHNSLRTGCDQWPV